ncbi:MAG: hypothetical protein HC898_04995 [Phycisphaerales bacterium]|nr:hypothetical protein [Phycisphaerales bacterium]
MPRVCRRGLANPADHQPPPGPFITSTLQQAAANALGFALQRTMRIAQQLYEGIDVGSNLGGSTGLITYMRTDSTHISGEALSMVRAYIASQLGEKYLPENPTSFPRPTSQRRKPTKPFVPPMSHSHRSEFVTP